MATPTTTGFSAQAWLEQATPLESDEGILEQQYADSIGRLPHSPPRHDMDKLTIYEILAQLENTIQLLEHIDHFPTLVVSLSSTTINHTIWAPTDAAFLKLYDVHKNLSKGFQEQILQHHISPHLMPISRILHTPNIPVLLCPPNLKGDQRLRLLPSLAGIQVNFDAHITEGDIIACNGVIHIIDSVVLPPPSMLQVVSLLPPGDFSVLQLALRKTGLADEIANGPFKGGTLFAPNNSAFRNLGEALNAFLFSQDGENYLQKLVKYHFVPNQTLYSNAFYKALDLSTSENLPPLNPAVTPAAKAPNHSHRLIKGSKNFELPTYLEEHSLSVNITRFGGIIAMQVNGFTPVTLQDGVANNGIVHVVSSVLVPPREASLVKSDREESMVLSLKELMSRFKGST